ncbi:MAG TPA: DNA primase [Bryobacteraceae bacterium]
MNFAEQLKSQLDIVNVVSHYVRLKRQGAGPRHVGLCPFHSEKTPSFGVHSGLQYYKCFGCDAAGDVFTFVQQIESLTFPETLKLLAERYGIPMPERQRSDDPETKRYAALLEMHEIAAGTFQDNLRGAAGAEARRYLESRGVSRGSMDEFRLGLADASGQQLTRRLEKFGAALLEESGLVAKRESGGFYDRFRGRLIFPIHNESGKVIGFGGRALRAGDEPKYLNSPETKLYRKSSVLYNLHRAKIEARKNNRMILVEGYMDVIGVYAAGIHEVVASSGTSLGIDQVRAIKRQISQQQAGAGQIFLNFDPDPAGARSTEKYISTLLAEGLRVKVLEIPGGLDPDEYIQQNGTDAYQKLLDVAPSYFHWLADRTRTKFDMKTAEGRVDAFKYLWPSIQQVSDKIERSAIANEIAENLNIDREIIRQHFRRAPNTETSRSPREISSILPPNEKLLLACLLASADARAAVKHYLSNSDLLHLLEARSIFEAVLRQHDQDSASFSLDNVMKDLDKRSQQMLGEVGFAECAIAPESAVGQALDALRALETTALEAKRRTLRQQIHEMENSGNLAEAMRLAAELDRLRQAPPEG